MGKEPIIIYFGDYDPSGEDIPRSLQDTLRKMRVDVGIKRVALMEEQVRAWKLPPAPTKSTDSRSVNWDGIGQVELDAVEPRKIIKLLDAAVAEIFDEALYADLIAQEAEEVDQFKAILKRDFQTLLD